MADATDGRAVRHTRGAFTLSQERASREDRHGSRGVSERVSRRKTLSYEIEGYACPNPAGGTYPFFHELFESHGLMGGVTETAVVSADLDPTVLACALSNPSAVKAGDAVGFVIGGDYFLRHVALNESGIIVWSPALPSAPSPGDAVYRTVNYRPVHRPEQSVSVWRFLDGLAFAYPGCVGEGWELSLSGGSEARFRFTGKGKDEVLGGVDALAGEVEAGDTVLSVQDADRFGPGMVLLIESELVKVLSTDPVADTLTALRGYGGTSAAGHAEETRIAPTAPAVTVSGSPVAGVTGRVYFGGRAFHITEASLTFKDGLRMRQTFGEASAAGFSHPERRLVQMSLTGFFTDETAGDYGAIKRFAPTVVDIQAGNAAGGALSLRVPKFEADLSEISAEPGEEVPLKISGVCLEDAGDDEVFLAFG